MVQELVTQIRDLKWVEQEHKQFKNKKNLLVILLKAWKNSKQYYNFDKWVLIKDRVTRYMNKLKILNF